MPFRVETGAQCQSYLLWIFGDVWLIEVMFIWRCVGIYRYTLCSACILYTGELF